MRAQKGTPTPGAEPATFKSFLDPVAGSDASGELVEAFGATLGKAARGSDTGIWAYTAASGEVKLVAREGGEPAGAPGTKWKTFTSLGVMEGRGPLFTATLASGVLRVIPQDDMGLWGTDSAGGLRLILREGKDIAPGRILRSFDVLEAVTGSPGQNRAWTTGDASARVIYRAFFIDGTSGIGITAVP